MKIRTLIAATATLIVLAGCGGGGSDAAPPASETVPDEASASVEGMAQWLGRFTATASEDREPLDASRFAPPQPDDSEPVSLR